MRSLVTLFPEPFQLTILDIGAAMADRPSYQSLVEAGHARIIGFEPDAAACESLNGRYGAPHRFFPHFIGDGRPATFHETNWALTGSLFPPNTRLLDKFNNLGELTQPVAQHTVTTTRLDDIAEIDAVDFIKIDVQGSELPIFQNGLRALSQALVVQTEVEFVELYKGQPMFADVDLFLRGQGFQFHTLHEVGGRAFKPLVHKNDINRPFRQFLWADAIYTRDWMQLEMLTPEKLRNYAVLAHDVLKSYDLAHHVLEALDRKTGSQLVAAYIQLLTGGATTAAG